MFCKWKYPISSFLNEGQHVPASPPALHHPDNDSSSEDENDDEDFQGVVMSPALSSSSDSSYSATDIGTLFCDAWLLYLIIS